MSEIINIFDENDYHKILNHLLFGKTEFFKAVQYSPALINFLNDENAKYLINKILKHKPELMTKEMIKNTLDSFSFIVNEKNDNLENKCVKYISEFLNLIKKTKSFKSFLEDEMSGNSVTASTLWILGTKLDINKKLMENQNYIDFKQYILHTYNKEFVENKQLQAKIYKHSARGFWSDTNIFEEVLNNIKFDSFVHMLKILRIDFLTNKEFEFLVEKNLNVFHNIAEIDSITKIFVDDKFNNIIHQNIGRTRDNEFDDKFAIIINKLRESEEKENIEKSNEYFNLYTKTFNVLLNEKYSKPENTRSEKKDDFVMKKLTFINELIKEQYGFFTEKEVDNINKLIKDLNTIVIKSDILSDKVKKSIDHFIMSYEVIYLNVNLNIEQTNKKRNKI